MYVSVCCLIIERAIHSLVNGKRRSTVSNVLSETVRTTLCRTYCCGQIVDWAQRSKNRRGLRNEMKKLGERATAAVIALFVKPKSDQPRGPLCLFERLQTELVQAHAADVWSVSEF